ncbi:MAG: DUF72 domain-containing protein [Nitrospiraceae bacterium]|nr:MAG: DUF72 domain-containing protein [Nitrospiraceae bacterium]
MSFYVEKFDTVELNVTFYRLLKKEAFERWYKETPANFSFSLKGSRFITHTKKLKDIELPLLTFFNTTAPLMEKLEVVLWQLPPNFKANIKNLEEFIEAIKLYPVRHAFEFRHKSWISSKILKLLSAANIAVCMADWPDFIKELPLTADFVYIRRHGEFGSYATNYTVEKLKDDAKRIKEYLKLGKDVYLFFNNDALGYAPKNALELKAILEETLPKSLKEAAQPEVKKRVKAGTKKAPKKKTAKPAKKVPKKKKPVKKPKTKKAVKKIKKKTKIKRPSKLIKKKVKKKTPKKTVKKKIAKEKAKKKPIKKTVKKKIKKKPIRGKPVKKRSKKSTVKKSSGKKPSRKIKTSKKKRR